MSVSTCSSRRPELTISSATSTSRGVVWALARVSDRAMTPFSGVRSSWLMLARKRDFSALARSSSAVRWRTRSSRDSSSSSDRPRSSRRDRARTPISSSRARSSAPTSPPSASQDWASARSGLTTIDCARRSRIAVCTAAPNSPSTSTHDADRAADCMIFAAG